mmetsp:Transcript_19043/g.35247  ORF Transcript_19043/g.35247 Transcript_19043/m.35247 type:complete len:118 (+) Transcript_19043:339-692(+)
MRCSNACLGSLAQDLEQFSKHAKRQTIRTEDVKLCARRNPKFLVALEAFEAEKLDAPKGSGKRKSKQAQASAGKPVKSSRTHYAPMQEEKPKETSALDLEDSSGSSSDDDFLFRTDP